jgi:CheY-like chemotaxis protein
MSAAELSATTPTLLVVDDEPNILNALRRLFRRDGYRLLIANGGEKALELLENESVDVVLSDQRMPKMSGIDLLTRCADLYPRASRVLLSGYADEGLIGEALASGIVQKFARKPWEDEQLRDAVRLAFPVQIGDDLTLPKPKLAQAGTTTWHNDAVWLASQRVMQQLPVPVIGIDSDGLVVFSNQLGNQILHDNEGELIGCSAADLFGAAWRRTLIPQAPDTRRRVGLCLRNGDQRSAWASEVVHHGTASGLLLVVTD